MLCAIVLVPYYATVAVPQFLCTFNVPLFVPLMYSYTVASLILTLVGINLYIHKATFHLLVKMTRSTAASFQIFLCHYVYKLTVSSVVDVLAVSCISRSRCGRLSSSCNYAIVLFCLLLFLFCCFLAPWLLPSRLYCFRCLGCRAVLCFSPPFLILAATFIALLFSSLPSILSLFSQQYRGFSFMAGP